MIQGVILHKILNSTKVSNTFGKFTNSPVSMSYNDNYFGPC